jgi:hypothetical protein
LFFFFCLEPVEPADCSATMKEMFKYLSDKQKWLGQQAWFKEEADRKQNKKIEAEMKKLRDEIKDLSEQKEAMLVKMMLV